MNYSEQVKRLNKKHIACTKTDYWRFMASNGFIDNRIEAKLAYLSNRFGFIKGQDKIDHDAINTLNLIGQHYFYIEVAPTKDWLKQDQSS